MKKTLLEQVDGTLQAINLLRGEIDQVEAICTGLIEVLRAGGTIYTAGNGGSATHALHLAEELIGRYRTNRRPLRAICLNSDSSALTCIANDFGFENVFSRQCEALLTGQDALCVFSTSGRSPNILAALHAARQVGAVTIGLLGRDGGPALKACDLPLVIPADDSAAIQDAHHVALHLFCEAIENTFSDRTDSVL